MKLVLYRLTILNRNIKDQISALMTSLAALLTFTGDYRNYQGNRGLFRGTDLLMSTHSGNLMSL